MKLDPNQSKAYGGAVSSLGSFLAGSALVEQLTEVIAWLITFVDKNPPPTVAPAIAFLLVGVGSYYAGKFITYMFPPNRVSAAMYTEAIREEASRTGEL